MNGATLLGVQGLGGNSFRWTFNANIVTNPAWLVRSEWTIAGVAPTTLSKVSNTQMLTVTPGVTGAGNAYAVPNYPQGIGASDTGPVRGGTGVTT